MKVEVPLILMVPVAGTSAGGRPHKKRLPLETKEPPFGVTLPVELTALLRRMTAAVPVTVTLPPALMTKAPEEAPDSPILRAG